MNKRKSESSERSQAEKEALRLLTSPLFFNEFLRAIKKLGLVGEELNALVLLVVVTSRLLPRPLSVFIKGHSSAGKNWLATRILRLLPKNAVAEITSASDKAWNYAKSDFRHRVVYLQERNEAVGAIDPIRMLISEGKLVRIVTGYQHGQLVTKKHVARGPVAAISTTTKNRLQIDDETRHISIWVDESSEQTRNIARSYARKSRRLTRRELRAWRTVQRLLARKARRLTITFPRWFRKVADLVFADDLAVRRYFPAFIEACRTVCLIRSFQDPQRVKNSKIEIDFADFAIATLIFDPVFVESLHLNRGSGEGTRRVVDQLSGEEKRPVTARDLARKLCISMDKAYGKLRYAAGAGAIRQVGGPEKNNRKAYLPNPRPHFIPDPKKLFRKLKQLKGPVRFVHSITGRWIVYERKS